jgi:hypothetical protein
VGLRGKNYNERKLLLWLFRGLRTLKDLTEGDRFGLVVGEPRLDLGWQRYFLESTNHSLTDKVKQGIVVRSRRCLDCGRLHLSQVILSVELGIHE